ncbi:XVIPCD domain-containing protein [Xanthomonas medicagonis]|uniref:XVIPCD domain-containing protein n=1 Tax=Xanthomonas medicagonis TaxID=3160841 RepID=UPI0035157FBB
MAQGYVYDALSRESFEVLSYNAVGRASEVNLGAAYALQHSTGNSGWSVGIMQWDFGQPGRGAAAEDMLRQYAQWASPQKQFTEEESADLLQRLQTRGQEGNALSATEQARLNEFLRSDPGRTFVQDLNDQQVERKWQAVGEPLARIAWLQDLNREHPEDVAKIVAMAGKLYNQNQARGALLVESLQQSDGMTANEVRDWIGAQGINGLNPAARSAIVSGRDATLLGVGLVNALELGDGAGAQQWHDEVRVAGNTALAEGFNGNPSLQMFDALLRDPANGARVLSRMDDVRTGPALTIQGGSELARLEISRLHVDREGGLSVTSPSGDLRVWDGRQWSGSERQVDPQYQGGAHPFGPPGIFGEASLTPSPVFGQCREHVHTLDRSLGRLPDEQSDRAAACLAAQAVANGLTRVDHVMLNEATSSLRRGEYLLAVQGDLNDPAKLRAQVATDAAINTPVETSMQRAAQILQDRSAQMVGREHQQEQGRSGPVMS